MANTYDVGDLPRVTGTLADSAGTASDPAGTITVSIKDPSGNTTSYVYGTDAELVKSSTGVYYVDVSVDEAGPWLYRFASGTGSGQAAAESYFMVQDSEF